MKVLVLGASLNPARYSYLALNDLVNSGHEVFAVGRREGEVNGVKIHNEPIEIEGLDTVTLYLGEKNQQEYASYLQNLKPKRVIFNPGAENNRLARQLAENGIEVLTACTLVMLRTNQF